jgi:tRNA(fMet)-specific endonuclease VapC
VARTLHDRGRERFDRIDRLEELPELPDGRFDRGVVTMEESIRGRLAVLARRSAGARRVRAYSRFLATAQLFGTIRVLPFTMACEQIFQELRSSGLRVGSQDLRIAATALVHEMRVVTRNRKDFGRVPDLALEDWSVGSSVRSRSTGLGG